jgi:hypothetical protein
MLELAKSLPAVHLAEKASSLHEKFRPEIPFGKKGERPKPILTSSERWHW